MIFPDLYKCKVAVIGLGYVGLPLAIEIAKRDRCKFTGKNIERHVIGFDCKLSRIEELQKHRDKPVILICKIGQHSSAAGSQLIKNGFQDVRRLSGGMTEWTGSNLPVVKG